MFPFHEEEEQDSPNDQQSKIQILNPQEGLAVLKREEREKEKERKREREREGGRVSREKKGEKRGAEGEIQKKN